MYQLKALIAAHRAKLAVAALGYALYSAIDPASSPHFGYAVAAVIMGLIVFVPAMLLAEHIDRVKPGRVEKPFKAIYGKRMRTGSVTEAGDDYSPSDSGVFFGYGGLFNNTIIGNGLFEQGLASNIESHDHQSDDMHFHDLHIHDSHVHDIHIHDIHVHDHHFNDHF